MSSWKAGKGAAQGWGKKESTISRGGPGKKQSESVGVQCGLSAYEANMNTQENEPVVDKDTNPLTGNPTERIKPRGWKSVSSKGKTFQVEK